MQYASQYGVKGRTFSFTLKTNFCSEKPTGYSGISSTVATVIGRRLGYNTSQTLNATAVDQIKNRALAMAAFNLFQPGNFLFFPNYLNFYGNDNVLS
jgi:hypothetical protein